MKTTEFVKKRNEILAAIDKEDNAEKREKLQRELSRLVSDYEADTLTMQRENVENAVAHRTLNTQLREFLKEKRMGVNFMLSREAIAGTKVSDVSYSQRTTIAGILENSFRDRVIYDRAGCPIVTGATSLADWIYFNNPTAKIENELTAIGDAQKLEEAKKSELPQRISVKIVISNQAIENNAIDLVALAAQKINAAYAEAINYAACSTAKFGTYFFGGFADTNKQTGTYTSGAFTYKDAMDMVGLVAKENFFPEYGVFVMGPADFYALKATPRDAGSGLMVIDEDGRLGGFPVFVTNAINRETQAGAASGHNIGFGCFNFLPCIQHGNVRLSIDSQSAAAADVDGVIITANSDWSMTNLYSKAFVLYTPAQQQEQQPAAGGDNNGGGANGGDNGGQS